MPLLISPHITLYLAFQNRRLIYLFWDFLPTRAFLNHIETSPLSIKDCKFWPMFGTHFGSGAVTTYFYDWNLSRLGFEHLTFRLRDERSNPLRQRWVPCVECKLIIIRNCIGKTFFRSYYKYFAAICKKTYLFLKNSEIN